MLLEYYGQVTKSLRIAACLATSLKQSMALEFIQYSTLASATPALRGSMVAVLFRVHGVYLPLSSVSIFDFYYYFQV